MTSTDAIKILDNMKTWSRLDREPKTRQGNADSIVADLDKLTYFSPLQINRAVQNWASFSGRQTSVFDQMDRIYLLNRYYNAVPELASIHEQGFLMIAKPAAPNPDMRRELWPLAIDQGGALYIEGGYSWYMGPYPGLAEFNYFLKKYGPRFPERGPAQLKRKY